MKPALFASLAAAALLTATSAFAAPTLRQGPADPRRDQHGRDQRPAPQAPARRPAAPRPADHFDRAQNYGFDRDHHVTREERYRWEQAHNYGYAASHRVSPQERARWETSYRH